LQTADVRGNPLANSARQIAGLTNAVPRVGQCNPEPEQQNEGDEGYVAVDDHAGSNGTDDPDHWPGKQLEKLIDDIFLARRTGKERHYVADAQSCGVMHQLHKTI